MEIILIHASVLYKLFPFISKSINLTKEWKSFVGVLKAKNCQLFFCLLFIVCTFKLVARPTLYVTSYNLSDSNDSRLKNTSNIVFEQLSALSASQYLSDIRIISDDYCNNNRLFVNTKKNNSLWFTYELEYLDNKKINIISELIDLQTKQNIRHWSASGLKTSRIKDFIKMIVEDISEYLKYLDSLEKLMALENSDKSFAVSLTTSADSLYIDDLLHITVKTTKSCYLYIFNIGTSGNVHLLFPNKYQKNNYVSDVDSVFVSGIQANPPAGRDLIKVFAATDSLSLNELVDFYPSCKAVFASIDIDIQTFSRSLEVVFMPVASDCWSTATKQINILNK